MFRSRSRFDNEAPMSRRGVRIGLVSTVVLAMVAVLAYHRRRVKQSKHHPLVGSW